MRLAELKVGLLFYMVGKEHIYAILLNQSGQTRQFQLTTCRRAFSQLDKFFAVVEGGYPLSARVSSVFHDFAFQWGKELLPPHEHLKAFDILVIIPNHTLHSLPLHTIWLEEEQQFLATAHGIAYCPSGTLFTRCVNRNVIRNLDLSTWEFSTGESSASVGPPSPRRCISVGRDVKGDQEVNYQQLANTFASYFDQAMSLDSWLDLDWHMDRNVIKYPKTVGGWETICIVCHGHYDAVFPDDSGLLLEGSGGSLGPHNPIYLFPDMGFMFRDLPFKALPLEIIPRPECEAELMTISELKVNCSTQAQLVALFGCSTGGSQVISGDDFGSIAHQWLKLGAASVLANFWKSDFAFIEQWSTYFLDNWLKKRQPKAVAWQQATRAMLGNNPGLDPYIWGTIALLGDWL